jgi:putative DNA-invertase from lambdoid prophage Rac
MSPPRARMYLRVSTKPRKPKPGEAPEAEKRGQTIENQRPDLEQLAKVRGFEITGEYPEAESTKKHRPVFARMLDDARRGAFDVLLIWALDRFGRDHVGNMLDVRELDRLNIRIVSVEEAWLDTTGPTRGLLVSIFSWVAEQERERRSERTKAGLARVRAHGSRSGKPIGRPRRLDAKTIADVRDRAARGESTRKIAEALSMPRRTVRQALSGVKGCPKLTPESSATSTTSAGGGH